MSFRKGIHYPHPPRGPGRGTYRMSDKALRARRRNLRAAGYGGKVKRLRSGPESRVIKLLIWQSFFDGGPRRSQRALARQLGVWPSYICKVQKQAATVGMDALVKEGRRVTLDDLAEARRFTAKLREREPGLLAPAPQPRASGEPRYMTADESNAEYLRKAREEQGKNPCHERRRVMSSVPPWLR